LLKKTMWGLFKKTVYMVEMVYTIK